MQSIRKKSNKEPDLLMTKNKQYSTQNMKLEKKSQYRIKNITNIFHLDLVLHDLLYQIQRQIDL